MTHDTPIKEGAAPFDPLIQEDKRYQHAESQLIPFIKIEHEVTKQTAFTIFGGLASFKQPEVKKSLKKSRINVYTYNKLEL